MWTSYGTGRVYPGESDIVAYPNYLFGKKTGVLYVHGAEGDIGGATTWTKIPTRIPLISRVVDEGYTMVSADLGGVSTWGNDVAMSRMDSAYSFLTSLSSVSTGKIVLVGQSMGGLNALLWAQRNPYFVYCVVCLIPVMNLSDVRNRLFQSSVDGAYGGSYVEQTMGKSRNPVTMSSYGYFDNLNIQIWYGKDDKTCLPSFTEQFVFNTKLKESYPVDGGHAEETVGRINPDKVMSFIKTSIGA